MVLDKSGYWPQVRYDPIIGQRQSEAFTGTGAGFGLPWALILQISGWVIQGIGLGLSAYDAITNAKQQTPPTEPILQEDISTIARQVAAADPRHRSAAEWETMLSQVFGPQVQPTPTTCPPGFYYDPTTRACMQAVKAGFQMPIWGWALVGFGAFLLLTQTGFLSRR